MMKSTWPLSRLKKRPSITGPFVSISRFEVITEGAVVVVTPNWSIAVAVIS